MVFQKKIIDSLLWRQEDIERIQRRQDRKVAVSVPEKQSDIQGVRLPTETTSKGGRVTEKERLIYLRNEHNI